MGCAASDNADAISVGADHQGTLIENLITYVRLLVFRAIDQKTSWSFERGN